MSKFSNILTALLVSYNEGGMEAVKEHLMNEPLSDETRREIEQSFALIDQMEENREFLVAAKDKGYTTEEWCAEEIEKISNKQ